MNSNGLLLVCRIENTFLRSNLHGLVSHLTVLKAVKIKKQRKVSREERKSKKNLFIYNRQQTTRMSNYVSETQKIKVQ